MLGASHCAQPSPVKMVWFSSADPESSSPAKSTLNCSQHHLWFDGDSTSESGASTLSGPSWEHCDWGDAASTEHEAISPQPLSALWLSAAHNPWHGAALASEGEPEAGPTSEGELDADLASEGGIGSDCLSSMQPQFTAPDCFLGLRSSSWPTPVLTSNHGNDASSVLTDDCASVRLHVNALLKKCGAKPLPHCMHNCLHVAALLNERATQKGVLPVPEKGSTLR